MIQYVGVQRRYMQLSGLHGGKCSLLGMTLMPQHAAPSLRWPLVLALLQLLDCSWHEPLPVAEADAARESKKQTETVPLV